MKLLLLILIFFISRSLTSQIKNHVEWNYEINYKNDSIYEIKLKAVPENDWHFYSLTDKLNPLIISFKRNNNYELIGKIIEQPQPIKEYDEILETERTYQKKECTFSQFIKLKTNKNFNIEIDLEYQACYKNGMCVMETKNIQATIDIQKKTIPEKTITTDTSNIVEPPNNNISNNVKLTTNVQSNISEGKTNLLLFFFFSFLAGLAAIITPCVFPMIPMTVSFFLHNTENRKKAKFQAIVFGISIILIYTTIGTVVTITLGANFANFLSTHWLPNIFFFLIFMIFAASFFGMFDIVLPSSWITKIDSKSEKGGIVGSFFMAFTLVLVSFSCTGPIVGSILVKSAGGHILEPIIGMFGFSLAFAIPFTFFAFFPHLMQKLPKSGGWLNNVKITLGFLELALGLKFLSIVDQTYHWRILDREIYLSLWIIIFTLMGFYFLGKLKFPHDSEVKEIGFLRLILAIITFSFVVYMIPGLFGAPLKALSGYLPPQTTQDFDINEIVRQNIETYSKIFQADEKYNLCEKPKYSEFLHLPHGLKGYFDIEQAKECAKKLNKPIFIDFTGHGCVNCREMEIKVWSHPQVLKRLRENFIVTALYVDDKTILPENEWIISKIDGKVKKTLGQKYADFQISNFKVNAQPYYVIIDYKGNLLAQPKAYDLNVENFIRFLDEAYSNFKKIYNKQ
ncbi:MAG: thioredoxin family protein [Bacteroidales bacterium]|nr:thioredoxin family protein [Bacteroidales bacterium]